ncbi:hypothetical protein [Terriglobus albidus]|uniref:hypothetical protein n=1 Tax=Terriglobus albidus TaxID=1592106 RepID=UPI0021DF50D0|nr:hypothetical protein [Terriglobus albidus]
MKLTSKVMKNVSVTLCVSGFLVLMASFVEVLLPFARTAVWIIFPLAMLVSITEGFPPKKSFWSRYPLWVPLWLKIIDAVMVLLGFVYFLTIASREHASNDRYRFFTFVAIQCIDTIRSLLALERKLRPLTPSLG